MPGGAYLYSLSVAWVSSFDPLAPKAWCPILGFVLVAVVAGVANPKRICAIIKRVMLFYAPIFMFEGVNAIQGILCLIYHGPIQIIANILMTI